ncbi:MULTISPECIES: hypothetical protein [unclassified Streptomyces]|uniref:hypothetical protein n=1 Tax=unclassified Streptomyces TaxID=2593676 RepID=UPI0024A9344F|nr:MULTISPECIES: hypothetical protein [unclassified Streptomyces]
MHFPTPQSVAELTDAVLAGDYGPDPKDMTVTSAFWIYHTTRLAGGPVTYHNHYLVLRVGRSFGGCSFEAGGLTPGFCENASGHPLEKLLRHESAPEVPLVVYAQTGSAVARAFLGSGVTALNAEPFPFSQFSADETTMYRYRAGGDL